MYRRLLALGLSCCLVGLPLAGRMAWGQADTKDKQKKDDDAEPKQDRGRPKNSIKPYDEVITAEAKSTPGCSSSTGSTTRSSTRSRPRRFGKDMLWVTQIERTQSGYGYGGSPIGDRVVRWEQRGDDVLLRDVNYAIRAEAKDPIQNAVEATSAASRSSRSSRSRRTARTRRR